jgi:hypothetical protein
MALNYKPWTNIIGLWLSPPNIVDEIIRLITKIELIINAAIISFLIVNFFFINKPSKNKKY